MPGLDLSKLQSIQEADEVSERVSGRIQPQSTTNKVSARGNMAMISPKAEKAKNALAERAKVGKTPAAGEEEGGMGTDRAIEDTQRELPVEEYEDFFNTYEEDKWWLNKDKMKKNESPEKPVKKHLQLDKDAISEKSGDDDEEKKSAENLS